ncbi:hypothetical protein DFJ58DRAFT_843138 [Suillus subalutaceus]|uniref:uncharacterized protein n=1 Tax=Suillus subalutaceus TaxID=48586 RepID=UPI001B8735B9|nr:uncharacterized protein DFJ58DRAFT_843138 [Suillus subalutaceus]KAG1847695.1 hypothetical protein DFJ58DRAFT_843138 [Suillus subalutaceus]
MTAICNWQYVGWLDLYGTLLGASPQEARYFLMNRWSFHQATLWLCVLSMSPWDLLNVTLVERPSVLTDHLDVTLVEHTPDLYNVYTYDALEIRFQTSHSDIFSPSPVVYRHDATKARNASGVDQQPSPGPSYMGSSPASFDYVEEQFGGGRRYEAPPPAELTPSWLRTRLKATVRDVGRCFNFNKRYVIAYAERGLQSAQTHPFLHYKVLHKLQDLFYGPMDQQSPWMQQNPSGDFGMMQPDTFTAGLLGDQALGMAGAGDKSLWPAPSVTNVQDCKTTNAQNTTHLAPLPSHTPFRFPASSSGQPLMSRGCSLDPAGQPSSGLMQNSPFTLHPAPYVPPQIMPILFQPQTSSRQHHSRMVGGKTPGASASTDNALLASTRDPSPKLDLGHYSPATTYRVRFPEESEPRMHQEDQAVTGRSVHRPPHDSTNQLYLKSQGRSVNGTNYWNLYANYFKDHLQEELGRCEKEKSEGSGTPSATLRRKCYEKFKDTFPDTYQDILSKHEEVALLSSSPQTIGPARTSIPKTLSECDEHPPLDLDLKQPLYYVVKWLMKMVRLVILTNTPGAGGFWEMRCRASDDMIIGHLKAHVYNTTSLSAVDDAFPETGDDSHQKQTPTITHDIDQASDVVEGGQEDNLKFVKQEITRQAAKFCCNIHGGKIFPWKLMPATLLEANLSIQGYPAHKCLFPSEAHTAAIASEKPIIEGEAPPSEWPHHGARRLFLDGHTDHNGLRRLKPSTATTKVKKGVKAPKHPIPPSEDEPSDDESLEGVSVNDAVGTSALEPLPQVNVRKPNYKMRVEVVPPPSRPFKVVRLPLPLPRPSKAVPMPSGTPSEVIEVTSTEENPVGEPDSEYEEAGRGKKRKLKSANTSRASKKIAPSIEKTNTSKVGKKVGRGKNNVQSKAPPPPLPTSTTFPAKGGPLSPLTVGSSTDGPPSPEHINAGKAMRLRGGPSDESKKVTKGSQVVMNRGLRMVYGNSDSESDVDNSVKANSATTMGVIPEATGSANIQSDPLEEKSAQTKDEVVGDKEELPPTAPLNAAAPNIPDQQPLRDSNTPRPLTPHKTQDERPHDNLPHDAPRDSPLRNALHDPPRDLVRDPRDDHDPPRAPRDLVRDPRDDHDPPCDLVRDPRDDHEPLRDPRDGREPPRHPRDGREPHEDARSAVRDPTRNHHEAVRDPHDGLRNPWDVDPRYPYTRGYSHEPARGLDRGTLHPRDAFYHRNPRYGPPQDPYESGDIRMESDLNTRDSSPVSDFHGNYGPSEREHAYPTRYGPGGDLGYTHEGGYRSRHNDPDERGQSLSPYHSRRVGGGSYREEGISKSLGSVQNCTELYSVTGRQLGPFYTAHYSTTSLCRSLYR